MIEAYLKYVEVINPRRTLLSGKKAIYELKTRGVD
jgi:hypothetical protein